MDYKQYGLEYPVKDKYRKYKNFYSVEDMLDSKKGLDVAIRDEFEAPEEFMGSCMLVFKKKFNEKIIRTGLFKYGIMNKKGKVNFDIHWTQLKYVIDYEI